MSWKHQKVVSALAIAAALLINCWPVHPPPAPVLHTVAAAP